MKVFNNVCYFLGLFVVAASLGFWPGIGMALVTIPFKVYLDDLWESDK